MSSKSLLFTLTLFLASCTAQSKPGVSKDKIADRYLACYALEASSKKQCVQELQFEAEKNGFKQFLNKMNLSCERVKGGPEFIEKEQAYLVQCSPNHKYLMRFNYQKNQWKLITGEQDE